MLLVHEATKEELEAALAKLSDPYKKFKDALVAGKRVRFRYGGWKTYKECTYTWNSKPEDYEIEPEYCGVTEEQWQFVIDGELLVRYGTGVILCRLTSGELANIIKGNVTNVSIVREKGIKQPAFGRDVGDNEPVVTHIKKQGIFRMNVARLVKWDDVDWFIEL